ncbi:DUF6745 domain-containing protein [Acaryochloris sp. IP29b_bin.148]|uniref:DUF6745 domain-containing protein n=1 Tax=Acaryochloris sp. IP29b_bin.148 TaxID=2969218 RepID=UPI0026399A4B|nr:hypothetical protein [Acaryochloris sp. IP29b_bin.148]
MLPISALAPHQDHQLQTYTQRWRAVACSTTPVDRQQAEATIQQCYAWMGKPQPEILFFAGPLEVQSFVQTYRIDQFLHQFGVPMLVLPLAMQLSHHVQAQLTPEFLLDINERLKITELAALSASLHLTTWMPIAELLPWGTHEFGGPSEPGREWSTNLLEQLWQQQQTEWRQTLQQQPGGDLLLQLGDTFWQWGEPVGQALEDVFSPVRQQPDIQTWEQGMHQMLATVGLVGMGWQALTRTTDVLHPCLLDFCVEVLNCDYDVQAWEQLRSLSIHCGLLLPCEKSCFVFDRPLRCLADPEGRLHDEGGPALQFADGYQSYQFHGVQLPERYGTVHPQRWQADWLLHEQNAELRRVLMQGIGYDRLCQELQAESLDTWREYALLRVAPTIDVEPIYLLKMTCPSTGYIHATRVPPSIQSAREAIRWVNWDTDPEEFAQES